MMKIDKSALALRPYEIAALAVIAATACFYMLVARPADARLAQIEQALRSRAAASQIVSVSDAHRNTAEKLAAFYAFFDRGMTYTDWLARFYDLAERTGVQARQAEYTRTPRSDVPLVVYEVSLPVSADYLKVRAFTEAVLKAIPVVSLDRVSFRRKEGAEGDVDADLRFTFYLPATSAAK
jgi:hypothetical protein